MSVKHKPKVVLVVAVVVAATTTSTVNSHGVSGQISRTGKAYFVTSLVRTPLSTTTSSSSSNSSK